MLGINKNVRGEIKFLQHWPSYEENRLQQTVHPLAAVQMCLTLLTWNCPPATPIRIAMGDRKSTQPLPENEGGLLAPHSRSHRVSPSALTWPLERTHP